MVESPLIIIIELIIGLIKQAIDTITFTISKFIELFISLAYVASTNILGFIIATVIGSIVLYFVLKVVGGSSKQIILLFLAFFVIIIIVVLIASLIIF